MNYNSEDIAKSFQRMKEMQRGKRDKNIEERLRGMYSQSPEPNFESHMWRDATGPFATVIVDGGFPKRIRICGVKASQKQN